MSILRRATQQSEARNADPEVVAVLSERRRNRYVDSGVLVNDRTSMRHAAVWACVRLVCSTIATMPVELVRTNADGSTDHLPLPQLLMRPDGVQTQATWIYQMVTSLLLRGNAYGEVLDREPSGYPRAIRLLHPDTVEPACNDRGEVFLQVRDHFGGANRQPARIVPVADTFHVAAYTRPGSPIGMSPVDYAAQSIGVGLSAEKFSAQWFGNGAHPSSVLKNQAQLTGEQAAEVKRRWRESVDSGDVAVLGGDWSWQQVQVAPEESQFLEAQEWSVAQIARVFGVPIELIGGSTKGSSVTYATVEGRNAAFLQFGLSLWLRTLEDALSFELPGRQRVRFRTDGLLRADTSARYQAYDTAIRAGFLTVDEVRDMEDLPPLGDAVDRPDPEPDDLS